MCTHFGKSLLGDTAFIAAHGIVKQKAAWLVFGSIGLFALAVVVAFQVFVKPKQLCTYFNRLRPGMTYSEVTNLLPQTMYTTRYACTSAVWQTVLVRSNAIPASELPCQGNSYPLLGGAEVGTVYFDDHDRLVGANYSSSGGGGWSPRWGVRKKD